jgi:hypothetical protein
LLALPALILRDFHQDFTSYKHSSACKQAGRRAGISVSGIVFSTIGGPAIDEARSVLARPTPSMFRALHKPEIFSAVFWSREQTPSSRASQKKLSKQSRHPET